MSAARTATGPRVLIFQIGSLGDTIVTIPALRAVRRHFGDAAELTLLHNMQAGIPVQPRDVLAGTGLLDRYLGYPFVRGNKLRALGVMAKLGCRLRSQRFEVVVSLAPAERAAAALARDQRFFRWCGIKRQFGFQPFPASEFLSRAADGHVLPVRHEAIFRLDRLRPDGIAVVPETDLAVPLLTVPDTDLRAARDWLAAERRQPDRLLVAIGPGSQMPSKDWPEERFAEVGRRLLSREKYELVVVGGEAEKAIGERLLRQWGAGLNAAGRFSVMGSGAVLSQCAFVFGLDTGTTHLAAALGIPALSLYSERANPGQWDPLGRGQVVICHRVPCAGCRTVICPIPEHPCMTGISIDAVWSAIEQYFLGENNGAADKELVVIEV